MGIFDMLGSIFSSTAGQAINYGFSKALQENQYNLNLKGLRESPTAQRQGLERAGYNPIMAINSTGMANATASGTAGLSDNGAGANYASMTNAKRLQKQEVAQLESQTRASNAQRELILEQAESQRYEQKKAEAETILTHLRAFAQDTENSWIDRRRAMEVATGYINAEANHLNSEANQLNAHTAQADYRLRKGVTDYENVQRQALSDFIKRHPKLKSLGYSLDTLGLKMSNFIKK